jgi:hypothetical protein
MATDIHATVEEMLEVMFSLKSVRVSTWNIKIIEDKTRSSTFLINLDRLGLTLQ